MNNLLKMYSQVNMFLIYKEKKHWETDFLVCYDTFYWVHSLYIYIYICICVDSKYPVCCIVFHMCVQHFTSVVHTLWDWTVLKVC